jgi:ERCC4-type nuclease
MKKKSTIEQLRKEILESLKLVTESNAPQIHQRIQSKDGYRWVENEIISLVLSTGQAPAMCIPQIESELK